VFWAVMGPVWWGGGGGGAPPPHDPVGSVRLSDRPYPDLSSAGCCDCFIAIPCKL
jgi:hypothetical protein